MESKEFVRWQDQEALHRFQLISPLIAADADPAKRNAERKKLAESHDISERTLRRYEDAFRKECKRWQYHRVSVYYDLNQTAASYLFPYLLLYFLSLHFFLLRFLRN